MAVGGINERRYDVMVLWGARYEAHQCLEVGLLTERTQRALWRARHGQTRHVEAQQPGELMCLDTFYIGKLKGVGKVWQMLALRCR